MWVRLPPVLLKFPPENVEKIGKSMLTEHQISYTRNRIAAEHLGLIRFDYKWRYIPTDKSGMNFVYCRNRADALELLNFWTGGDWIYRIPVA